MTGVSVVANAAFTPPRMEVTCTVPAGDVMKNPTLNRIVNGVATPTLMQPSAGLDTQLVYDYLPNYGVPVSYEFVTDYTIPGAAVWDELWANLSAWSGTTSGYSVSGGKLTGSGGAISRAVTSGSYRVYVASLSAGGGGVGYMMKFATSGQTYPLAISTNSAGYLTILGGPPGLTVNPGGIATPIVATSPFTIDFLGTSIVITGTGGTYTLTGYTSTDFSTVYIWGASGSITVGEVKVSTYGSASHQDTTSTPVTLSPSQAWLIHPGNPALSVPISSTDQSAIAVQNLGTISQASSSTLHQILGQSLPIETHSGPRFGNTQSIALKTRTPAHEAALNGILADGTPLLFRFPPTIDVGFDEGFYSFGNKQRSRIAQKPGSHLRQFVVDITQVQQPTVIVQNAGWSWAALAAAFPTWAAVAQAYNTWADVLTNNRKPGY